MNNSFERTGKPAESSPKRAEGYLEKSPKVVLPKNADSPLMMLGGGDTVALASEAYKTLRTRLMGIQATRGIRSIAVTSAVQADGKTLTSYNLACSCAQLEGTSVVLIDSDLRTRGLTRLIGNLQHPGLANALDGTVPYEDVVFRTDMPNLCVVGAGASNIDSAELFSGDAWKQFIDWASVRFKLVLVDSLPIGSVADYDLIEATCGGTLVVVRSQYTPRGVLERALERIDHDKLTGVVWNSAPDAVGYYTAYAYRRSSVQK